MTTPAPKPAPVGVNSQNGPMRGAAKAGDWTEVFRLIDREGGDVNAELGARRRTLLQRAAYKADTKLMDRLHGRNARVKGVEDSDGFNMAFSVLANHQTSSVQKINALDWLRNKGLDLSQQCGASQQSLLHVAATKQDAALMDYLLNVAQLDPNVQDKNGNTPLMALAERSPGGVARVTLHRMMHMLIDAGAELDHVNLGGQTAILIGMRYESYLPNAQLLFDAGAKLDNPRMPHSLEVMIRHHNKSTIESYPRPYGGGPYSGSPGVLNDKTQQFINRCRMLPTIDLESYFRKDALFTPDAQGMTPLDNPETWKNLGAIAEHLERRRDPLTRDDLLAQHPVSKKPFLQRAIECRALNYVLPVLEERGQWIEPLDFVADPKTGKLNVLGQAAFEARTIQREIFTHEVWSGRTQNELRAFHRDLPPTLQNDVGNLHTLLSSLKREQDRGRQR